MFQAQITILENQKRLALDNYDYDDSFEPSTIPQTQPERISEKLSTIVKAYRNEYASLWKPRSQTQYERIENRLLETSRGDTPIHSIDYQRAIEINELLMAKKKIKANPSRKAGLLFT